MQQMWQKQQNPAECATSCTQHNFIKFLELKMENIETNEIVEIIESIEIAKLDDDAKLKDVIAKVNELIERINNGKSTKARDRGPDSTREMTEDDARRILLGDMKDVAHKKAAEELGLSYGQIYSARKGFTFKGIYKEWRDAQ